MLESLAESPILLFRENLPYDLRVWGHQHTKIKHADIQLSRNLTEKYGRKLVYLVYEGRSLLSSSIQMLQQILGIFKPAKEIDNFLQYLSCYIRD